jgi:HEAT repeat protein
MYRSLILILLSCLIGCGRGTVPDADQPVSHWLGLLKSADRQDRKKAIRMLAEKKETEAAIISELIVTLKDKHPDVRYEGIQALGKLGTGAKDALPALRELQKDPDYRLRMRVAEAIRRIQQEKP